MLYLGNYLSCQVGVSTLSVNMETKSNNAKRRELPLCKDDGCNFEGYNPSSLMAETAKLRNLITKRGTLEILIPLCCSTNPVRHKKFRETLKGINSKTLAYTGYRSLKRMAYWRGIHIMKFRSCGISTHSKRSRTGGVDNRLASMDEKVVECCNNNYSLSSSFEC